MPAIVATPKPEPQVVPSYQFSRPCEDSIDRHLREKAQNLVRDALGEVSEARRQRFLTALYDAQENMFAERVGTRASPGLPDVEFEDAIRTLIGTEELGRVEKRLGISVRQLLSRVYESRALRTGTEVVSDQQWFATLGSPQNCDPFGPEQNRVADAAQEALWRLAGPAIDRCDKMAKGKTALKFWVTVNGTISVEGGVASLPDLDVNSHQWPQALTNASALERCYRDAFEIEAPIKEPNIATGLSVRWEVSVTPT
jgi:hypothetical protein